LVEFGRKLLIAKAYYGYVKFITGIQKIYKTALKRILGLFTRSKKVISSYLADYEIIVQNPKLFTMYFSSKICLCFQNR